MRDIAGHVTVARLSFYAAVLVLRPLIVVLRCRRRSKLGRKIFERGSIMENLALVIPDLIILRKKHGVSRFQWRQPGWAVSPWTSRGLLAIYCMLLGQSRAISGNGISRKRRLRLDRKSGKASQAAFRQQPHQVTRREESASGSCGVGQ